MSRPSRSALPTSTRERLKQDSLRAAPLRQLHPKFAQLRVELDFEDDTAHAHSPQALSYFPAARGFFRYACPCHSCSGEFDLTGPVAELADNKQGSQPVRRLSMACGGQRIQELNNPSACPIRARVRISAVLHNPE